MKTATAKRSPQARAAANRLPELALLGGPKAVTNQLPHWPQFSVEAI